MFFMELIQVVQCDALLLNNDKIIHCDTANWTSLKQVRQQEQMASKGHLFSVPDFHSLHRHLQTTVYITILFHVFSKHSTH